MSAIETKQLVTIPVPAKGFIVVLSNRGNPDFRQNSSRPLPGVPVIKQNVATLAEASKMVRDYIQDFRLGMGNWVGSAGSVLDAGTKKEVAKISYNGRAWLPGVWPQPEVSLDAAESHSAEVCHLCKGKIMLSMNPLKTLLNKHNLYEEVHFWWIQGQTIDHSHSVLLKPQPEATQEDFEKLKKVIIADGRFKFTYLGEFSKKHRVEAIRVYRIK